MSEQKSIQKKRDPNRTCGNPKCGTKHPQSKMVRVNGSVSGSKGWTTNGWLCKQCYHSFARKKRRKIESENEDLYDEYVALCQASGDF